MTCEVTTSGKLLCVHNTSAIGRGDTFLTLVQSMAALVDI